MKAIDRFCELVAAANPYPREPLPTSQKDFLLLCPCAVEARKFPYFVSQADLQSELYFGQFAGLARARVSGEENARLVELEFDSELSATLAFMVKSIGAAADACRVAGPRSRLRHE